MHVLTVLLAVSAAVGLTVDSFPLNGGRVDVTVDDAGRAEITFLARSGATRTTTRYAAFRSPQVSPDGAAFSFLTGDSLLVVDGEGRMLAHYRAGVPYAVASPGDVAIARADSVLIWRGGVKRQVVLPGQAVGVAWQEGAVLAASPTAVFAIKGEALTRVFSARQGERITWLGTDRGDIHCRIRGTDGAGWWAAWCTWDGATFQRGATHAIECPPAMPGGRGFPWPFLPDTLPAVGNSYGEYQNYGASPYRHPGVDLMGSDYQPVYAVAGGIVKAVLTTSGSYHWRVAIADSVGSGLSTGWLYAHLDLATIAVAVGDTVAPGDYLGGLVPWPVANFTHLHFARIAAAGATWDGQWLCVGNPMLVAEHTGENDVPFFETVNGALLAFCRDNTSEYLPPDSLAGSVDIIAHVGDRIKSGWTVGVHEIRYSIHPQGLEVFPVVPDRCAVYFDDDIDVYQGGASDESIVPILWKQDWVCPTAGDYDAREFYHIITNSDGDSLPETSDEACSFNTTLLPDGPYVIRVTARDASGNSATDSMTVTLVNGNPPLTLHCLRSGDDLLLSWRPMAGATGYLVYRIPAAYSAQQGTLLAVVADTCFLVAQPFVSGSEGYYRVVATDARGRFGSVSPASNTAAP